MMEEALKPEDGQPLEDKRLKTVETRAVTPPAQPGGWTGFLDDVIVELGYTNQETVDWAVDQGRQLGQSVGTVLVDSKIVSEDQLSRAIAEMHGLEHVELALFDVDLDVARLISRQAARRYHAVPIAFDSNGELIVALADPVDPLAVSDIAVMTRSEVHPMVASESSIDAVAENLRDARGIGSMLNGYPGGGKPEVMDHQAVPTINYGAPQEPAPQPRSWQSVEPPAPAKQEAPAPPKAEPEQLPPAQPTAPAQGLEPLDDTEMPEELVRARSALAQLSDRLAAYEPRSRELAAERDALQAEVERGAEERDRLRQQLEDSELRAQAAQASLEELRGERDRERDQRSGLAEQLEKRLAKATDANRRLEQRLGAVIAATAEVRAACENLVARSDDRALPPLSR